MNNTNDDAPRSILLAAFLCAALGTSLAACSDKDAKPEASKTTTAGATPSDEPSYAQPRIGVEWCDKLLVVAECTAPKYKKKEDRIEAAAVWRMRAEQWKKQDPTAANQECEKKYQKDKEYAPEYDNGSMVSCYE